MYDILLLVKPAAELVIFGDADKNGSGGQPERQTMNGHTYNTPIETRLQNLAAQIPQAYRARSLAAAVDMANDGNPHTLENVLTGFCLVRGWEAWQEADRLTDELAQMERDNLYVATGLERDGAATGISQPEIY
jgi:glycine/D-amino acid oxidase-like deaminating enzyme